MSVEPYYEESEYPEGKEIPLEFDKEYRVFLVGDIDSGKTTFQAILACDEKYIESKNGSKNVSKGKLFQLLNQELKKRVPSMEIVYSRYKNIKIATLSPDEESRSRHFPTDICETEIIIRDNGKYIRLEIIEFGGHILKYLLKLKKGEKIPEEIKRNIRIYSEKLSKEKPKVIYFIDALKWAENPKNRFEKMKEILEILKELNLKVRWIVWNRLDLLDSKEKKFSQNILRIVSEVLGNVNTTDDSIRKLARGLTCKQCLEVGENRYAVYQILKKVSCKLLGSNDVEIFLVYLIHGNPRRSKKVHIEDVIRIFIGLFGKAFTKLPLEVIPSPMHVKDKILLTIFREFIYGKEEIDISELEQKYPKYTHEIIDIINRLRENGLVIWKYRNQYISDIQRDALVYIQDKLRLSPIEGVNLLEPSDVEEEWFTLHNLPQDLSEKIKRGDKLTSEEECILELHMIFSIKFKERGLKKIKPPKIRLLIPKIARKYMEFIYERSVSEKDIERPLTTFWLYTDKGELYIPREYIKDFEEMLINTRNKYIDRIEKALKEIFSKFSQRIKNENDLSYNLVCISMLLRVRNPITIVGKIGNKLKIEIPGVLIHEPWNLETTLIGIIEILKRSDSAIEIVDFKPLWENIKKLGVKEKCKEYIKKIEQLIEKKKKEEITQMSIS